MRCLAAYDVAACVIDMDAYGARMELQGRVVAGVVGEHVSGYADASGCATSAPVVDIICLVLSQ